MFYVGQKVVCVNARSRPNRVWLTDTPPKEGEVYTIDGLSLDRFDGTQILFLAEIKNYEGSDDWGFASFRFRPVVDRKTDISIFKAMLNPADKRVEA